MSDMGALRYQACCSENKRISANSSSASSAHTALAQGETKDKAGSSKNHLILIHRPRVMLSNRCSKILATGMPAVDCAKEEGVGVGRGGEVEEVGDGELDGAAVEG
jgi:hypothetical protein